MDCFITLVFFHRNNFIKNVGHKLEYICGEINVLEKINIYVITIDNKMVEDAKKKKGNKV